MKLIAASVLILFLLFEGLGTWLGDRLNCTVGKYGAPYGAAAFFALIAIIYYPIEILHGDFRILFWETVLVVLFMLYCTIRSWKTVLEHLKSRSSLCLLIGAVAFCFIFYHCYVDLEFSDATMYLGYISQDIGNAHINLFNPYTGVSGKEWDSLYLYQAYYPFVSVYICTLNLTAGAFRMGQVETLKAAVWGMGMLYQLVSTALLINITALLKTKNVWQKRVLLFFGMFYLNLYYWRVVDAWYGNTWRTLFLTLLMVSVYRWIAGEFTDSDAKKILPVISFAGIACSSSYLFISFALLSILAAYLFLRKGENVFQQMSVYVIPLVVYACVMLTHQTSAAYLIMGFFAVYYFLLFTKQKFRDLLHRLDLFIEKHARLIFVILIPCLCMGYSLYLHVAHPEFLYDYDYFFRNHQDVDMVKDYFFVYSTWLDNLINVLRWIGVILLIQNAVKPEDLYLKVSAQLMILVFMNPLATPAIAAAIASNVFYRAWEVMFNPFTELFLINLLFQHLNACRQGRFLQICLAGLLLFVTIDTNVLALRGDGNASYGFYVSHAGDTDPLSKVTKDEAEAIDALKQALGEEAYSGTQPIILSQIEATRSYLPNVIQLITPRDTYYTDTRVNEDLYQIARRHHPWDEATEAPYEETAALLKQYQVQYAVVRYWENPEYDAALSECGTNIYQNSTIRIYQIS